MRVGGRSCLRGDDHDPVAVGGVHQWGGALLARLRPGGRDEHERRVRERAGDRAAVRTELGDEVGVELVPVHLFSHAHDDNAHCKVSADRVAFFEAIQLQYKL